MLFGVEFRDRSFITVLLIVFRIYCSKTINQSLIEFIIINVFFFFELSKQHLLTKFTDSSKSVLSL